MRSSGVSDQRQQITHNSQHIQQDGRTQNCIISNTQKDTPPPELLTEGQQPTTSHMSSSTRSPADVGNTSLPSTSRDPPPAASTSHDDNSMANLLIMKSSFSCKLEFISY